ncbi:hypothetical protein D910_00508 [Dendroctonus ponderosae]|uniref:carbonic anhydrase n=1 Tax=Dendroctonus ponderosae TaxID=77166 RepID=U4UP85_DENPD|nr:hypothetical protein D910_00508 [Dendroctonus ponderosae]
MARKIQKKGKWTGVCSMGHLQSPIPLFKRLSYHIELPALKFRNFHELQNVKVENTGFTIRCTFPNTCHCDRPKICGGGLVRNYTLNHIHFHWPGEHFLDGIRYDLEMHCVFYADRYGTFENALEHPYGITVMAILLLLSPPGGLEAFC